MSFDRYGHDILSSTTSRSHRPAPTPDQPAERGLVVEEVTTGFVGAVTRVEKSGGLHIVVLEDRHGKLRSFRLGPGFWVDGKAVNLTAPVAAAARAPQRTASGSVSAPTHPARVALGSRIWVEGRHDAELIEKVWGDDLRYEGIVVELLDGIDNLEQALHEFDPQPDRKAAILVDHLVAGSKEYRIAQQITQKFGSDNVLVLGHPYVDVWQAVKPHRIGLDQWPTIDRSVEWKEGILAHLGWPHESQTDIAQGWKRILGSVRGYADLEPTLIGRVEELIDFITA
ncbi:DUF3097 domain-containing protein [Timonella sp. A28]|uniref:DUF3097 domain-containing protein n=1 Tax=Timonella sp. A28 TaxID=3442640 RepID=UPI003EB7FF90